MLGKPPRGRMAHFTRKPTWLNTLEQADLNKAGECGCYCILVDPCRLGELAHGSGKPAVVQAVVCTGDGDVDRDLRGRQCMPSLGLHQVPVELYKAT